VIYVREGKILIAEENCDEELTTLECVPLTHGGRIGFQVENVLAACAAVWSLGMPLDAIRAGLASFRGDAKQVPGRFNVLHADEATVIVDYAHNPSALSALADSLVAFPHHRRSLVFAPPSDRRDTDVLSMGRTVGDHFDRVILYRNDDESTALLRRGIAEGSRNPEVSAAHSELAAIELALADLHPGDLLVIGVDSIEEAVNFVQTHLQPQTTP
jgi:cyanophycin synthetase